MGTKKNVTIAGMDEVKIVAPPVEEVVETTEATEAIEAAEVSADGEVAETVVAEETAKPAKVARKTRSKKYAAKNAQVDKTIKYELQKAVETVKKLSYSKFDGTIEAHLIVKEVGITANVSFPHSTGKSIKAVIFNEEIAKELADGVISFDVLVASAPDMAKLTKFARLLGPKGLMPNPKNGTLTTNPEGKVKELAAGKVTLKTEKKAPLMHVGVGKVSMETTALVENIQAMLDALQGKVLKLTLSATMSPGVKVIIEK